MKFFALKEKTACSVERLRFVKRRKLDAVVRGDVEPAAPDAKITGPVDVAGRVGEEEEDRDSTDEGADVRPLEQPGYDAYAGEALVSRSGWNGRGRRRHLGSTSIQ